MPHCQRNMITNSQDLFVKNMHRVAPADSKHIKAESSTQVLSGFGHALPKRFADGADGADKDTTGRSPGYNIAQAHDAAMTLSK